MIKKVVLVGPESTGKSTLARRLANYFDTEVVEEYGRIYCEKFGNDCDAMDHCHIAAGQLFLQEQGLARARHGLLICDTDVLVTQTFAELYLGECPEIIKQWAAREHYDLYLLLDTDVPWVNDSIRLFADRRQWHFNRLKELLEAQQRPYVVISGDYEQRFQTSVALVKALTAEAKRPICLNTD